MTPSKNHYIFLGHLSTHQILHSTDQTKPLVHKNINIENNTPKIIKPLIIGYLELSPLTPIHIVGHVVTYHFFCLMKEVISAL